MGLGGWMEGAAARRGRAARHARPFLRRRRLEERHDVLSTFKARIRKHTAGLPQTLRSPWELPGSGRGLRRLPALCCACGSAGAEHAAWMVRSLAGERRRGRAGAPWECAAVATWAAHECVELGRAFEFRRRAAAAKIAFVHRGENILGDVTADFLATVARARRFERFEFLGATVASSKTSE